MKAEKGGMAAFFKQGMYDDKPAPTVNKDFDSLPAFKPTNV